MNLRVLVSVLSVIAFMAGCSGVDSELVASGKIHACKLAELEKQSGEEDPAKMAALTAEKIETATLLTAVIETADEGDRSALGAAIKEAVSEGCD